jgi:predicted kinase
MLSEKDNKIVKKFIDKLSNENISKEYKLLICPIGPTASGKSTVLVPLSEKLKIPRVSNDEIRKELKENSLSYSNLYEINEKVARYFLDQGFGLVMDSDCITKVDLIKQVSKEYNLKIFWIHIIAPEDFIINKIRSYKGDKWMTDDQEKVVENYYERKKLHGELLPKLDILFDMEIDTSKSVEINIIMDCIKKYVEV